MTIKSGTTIGASRSQNRIDVSYLLRRAWQITTLAAEGKESPYGRRQFAANLHLPPCPNGQSRRVVSPWTSRRFSLDFASLVLDLESAGKGVADPVVDGQQLLTGEGHRSDAHDRDQRGNQAIFDGGDAGFVVAKTSDNVF